MSSDLARDVPNLAGTGKVVTPATRFTVTSSYGVLVGMPNLPEKTSRQNVMLAGTYGVEFWCLKVVNPMSYLTVGSLENTSRLVDVSLNWTINSTG